ncbi:MFS transporter [Gryllotalpicola koreensis]|uniref:MFS transporter n=1 Tax=Gryllotalpicola koreensis TaxID=993086 RepID=A0ABP8A5D5_9MICO
MLSPLLISVFGASLSTGLLTVSAPRIGADIGLPTVSRAWLLDAYPLCLAAVLAAAARLGDRYGRRPVLLTSSTLIVVASVGAALSPGAATLIAWRCAHGVAGAGVLASVVGTIGSRFAGADLAVANGAWVAAVGAGNALGPVVGGVITDMAGWRWLFAFPALAALVSIALSIRFLPNSSAPDRPRMDPLSMVLAGVAAGTLIEGVNVAPGSPIEGAVLLLVCASACVALFRRQRRSTHPMIDVSLFRDRRFAVAAVQILVSAASASGCMYLVSLHVQQSRGYTATAAGLVLLPLAIGTTAGGVAAPFARSRLSSGAIVRAALVLQGVGAAGAGVAGTPLQLAVALAVAGIGYGIVGTVATTTLFAIAAHVRASQAGVLQEMTFALGSGIGIALFGTVAASSAGFSLTLGSAAAVTAAAALLRSRRCLTRRGFR